MMGNLTARNKDKEVTTQDNSQVAHGTGRTDRTVTPRASVYETPESVILELEMPGVARDSIEIKVENDELSVCGQRFMPADERLEILHQERLPLSYRRAFILSDRIDPTNIEAACNNGVLKLTLPKAAEAKPKKITIE